MSRPSQRISSPSHARAPAEARVAPDAQAPPAPPDGHAPPAPPAPVRIACALWVTAVAAGVFEAALAVGRYLAGGSDSAAEIAVGLAVRLPVFTAALLVALHMRRGHGWARTVLTLGLGVVGTASMVIEPIQALAQGRTLGTELAEAGAMDLLFGASRATHVAAVLSAVVLMFLPAANDYFIRCRADRAPGSRAPGNAR